MGQNSDIKLPAARPQQQKETAPNSEKTRMAHPCSEDLHAANDDFVSDTVSQPPSKKQSLGAPVTMDSLPPAPVPINSIAQRLMMIADPNAPNDQPLGVANICMCAGLLDPILTATPRDELRRATGFGEQPFDCLRSPSRLTAVLLSEKALCALEQTRAGLAAKLCWQSAKANLLHMQPGVEQQVNELARDALGIQEDLFKPGSLANGDEEVVLGLLALESIKVAHRQVLQLEKGGKFNSPAGELDAFYAYDTKLSMPFMQVRGGPMFGDACQVVEVPSKPDSEGARSLYFLLPDDPTSSLESCILALAERIKMDGGMRMECVKDMNFKFPCFDATHNVKSIVQLISSMGAPSMFSPHARPFEESLPASLLETNPAYVGNMLHFASFSADRKGAEAKALTAASVVVFRSLAPPVSLFHCDRPFVVILANGRGEHFNPEFVLKVTGDCLTTEVDA